MRSRPITPGQLEELRAACRGPLAERDRALLDLLANTGLRISEALGLDADSLRDGWLWVRPETAKGGKGRAVPANAAALAAIQVLAAFPALGPEGPERPLVRSKPGRRLGVRQAQIILSHLGKRIGIHLHPHMLRHYFLSSLLSRGVPIHVARDLAGHSNIAVTDCYLQSFPDQLVAAVKKLEN